MQVASNMIASRPEMKITAFHEKIGYFRPCKLNERLKDAVIEAKEHGSILAVRGSLFCIMPTLIAGWVKVNAGWKQ